MNVEGEKAANIACKGLAHMSEEEVLQGGEQTVLPWENGLSEREHSYLALQRSVRPVYHPWEWPAWERLLSLAPA